jgi:hypothetical protein
VYRLISIFIPLIRLKVLLPRHSMKTTGTLRAVALFLVCNPPMFAAGKPTGLSEAQAAVETNMRSPEGKAYDDKIGNEFLHNHLGEVRSASRPRAEIYEVSGFC